MRKSIKEKPQRPIAISACIAAIVTTGMATHSWVACVLEAIFLAVASICWYKLGSKFAQEAVKISKGRNYVFLGYADHKRPASNPNLGRLLLGVAKYRYRIDNQYSDPEVVEVKHKVKICKIDVVTDELIVGKEYSGDIFYRDSKPAATLRPLVLSSM